MRRHIDWAARFAARVGGADAAEDIVQDAFVRVHRALGEFEGRSSFRTYLYRIVLNVARDHVARERRRREHLESLASEEAAADRPGGGSGAGRPEDPRVVLERGELAEKVEASIEALPRAQRETLMLRVHEGLSYGEIAELMSVTVHAVKWNLAAARDRLAVALGSPGRVRGGER